MKENIQRKNMYDLQANGKIGDWAFIENEAYIVIKYGDKHYDIITLHNEKDLFDNKYIYFHNDSTNQDVIIETNNDLPPAKVLVSAINSTYFDDKEDHEFEE